MPGFGGVEAIRRIGNGMPPPASWFSPCIRMPPLPCRRSRREPGGYVTKSSAPEMLIRAAFEVLQGAIALSADIEDELARSRVADTPTATDAA